MSTKPLVRAPVVGVVATIAAIVALTAVAAPLQRHIGLLNEGLFFLLLVLLVSAVWGWQVGLFSAVLANLVLNFFFVPPLHRFTVQSPSNVIALVVFLLVSAIGGSLLAAARAAAEQARQREAETGVLLRLTRAMIGQTDPEAALTALCREVVAAFGASGAAVISGAGADWRALASAGNADAARAPDSQERVMAERALESGSVARLGHTVLSTSRQPRIVRPAGVRSSLPAVEAVAFAPLRVGDRALAVLRIDGSIGDTPFGKHPERLLAAFASEAALAVQRAELAEAAAQADALMRADEMKTALMTSISHDLKTPLAGIKTSVSSMLDGSVEWTDDDRRAFLETIDSQADRLNRVISDILDLNRIESGAIAPDLRPVDVAALFAEARERTALVTAGRPVLAAAPADARVTGDASLLAHALVNLIENAAKYSAEGGEIRLVATARGDAMELRVEDDGPGIARADLPHVFERFYRAAERSRRVKGSGLGLAIVKGFVTLSGGQVRAESNGGARFIITLPRAVRESVAAL